MKKDIFKALIISVFTLSLIFTLLACVGKDNFTPSGTLPDTPGQNEGNGENDPHKPSTPGTTDKPTDPATPDVPVTPSDPADPGDPIVPVTPSDPEQPNASDIPDTPAEPSAAVEQKPAQKTLDILDSTTKQDFENIIKGGLASTLVSLADGTVWGVDEDNNEGFTLRSSKPAIKLSVSPGAAIVFSGNDTYKGLSNVVDAYSEQRAMGGWILQGNGDLWVWDRDGVTVYDPVKIAENIAQYFQDQKVAITKDGDLVYIDYQAQEGKLDSLEITKLIDNVKTYSQGLAIDNNNMVWRINGGKAAKMLSHGKTIANENYVITQHNELWYIPYSGYPRMISENTSEYYGGEHNVILNTKGALTYTAEEKTQLIAENVARVFASSTFIDKTGSLYRYDFKSKEKTLIDINVVHYESGYYIRSDATLWKICYEDDELCSKQILDNVLMPGQTPEQPNASDIPDTPAEPSAAVDRYPDWNANDYQGVLKAVESRNPQFLITAADGKVYGIWEIWKGSYYEWTVNFLEDYYTPLKFLDGAQLDINGDLYATNTMDVQYTKLFADVIDADAEGNKGWALLSKGELWYWNAVVEDEKVAYKQSLIKTNVAKASAYSYTDLSGDSFSYTVEYGQDGTPYLSSEKKSNKTQEDLSPETPISQSCKYVFESIGETAFSYIDLEHNLYVVKDGIHKLLAEDVVYAAVWGDVCAFVKADGTLWIDNQKILDNVLMPGQTPVQPTDPVTPVPPITPSISVSPSDIGKFYAKTDIK